MESNVCFSKLSFNICCDTENGNRPNKLNICKKLLYSRKSTTCWHKYIFHKNVVYLGLVRGMENRSAGRVVCALYLYFNWDRLNSAFRVCLQLDTLKKLGNAFKLLQNGLQFSTTSKGRCLITVHFCHAMIIKFEINCFVYHSKIRFVFKSYFQ